MTTTRIALFLAGVLLVGCSKVDDGVARTISPTIILVNARVGAPPPPGPFASVLDSIELQVTPENGEAIAPLGVHLGGYRTTATLQPTFPPGNTTFTADIFSNTRVILFTGSVSQVITSDILSLPLTVAPIRPVLLVAPDTARTTTVTSTQFSIYNAGIGSLDWSLIGRDTAFTRCGAQCTISATSGSVAPQSTTLLRVTVPTNFPTRLFSFTFRSAEGNVTAHWQYATSPVSGVTISPTASLHNIGQAFPLTASAQVSGNTSTAVSWSSSSSAVATVTNTGVVLGVAPRVATVTAASVVDTSKKAAADIRVYDSTVVNTSFALVQPATPDTLRRDDTSPGSHSSVLLRAQVPGTSAPFTAVEFWVRPGSAGPWRRVGQSSSAVETTDPGGGRAWSWSYTWNPDAADAPFTNPSTTGMSVLAIGITPAGLTSATPPSSNVLVRVP